MGEQKRRSREESRNVRIKREGKPDSLTLESRFADGRRSHVGGRGRRRRLTTSPKRARERKKAMTSAAARRSRFSPEINILHFSVRSSPPPSSLVPFSSQFSPNGSTKCHQIRGEGERGGRGKRWSLCALPPSLSLLATVTPTS